MIPLHYGLCFKTIVIMGCLAIGSAARAETRPPTGVNPPLAIAVDAATGQAKSEAGAPIMGIPVNPDATPEAKAVLQYLSALSTDKLPGVISGQLAGRAEHIASEFASITQLHETTHQWVGTISVEYEFAIRAKPDEIVNANKVMTDYWKQGGLVSVGWAPVNPWTGQGNWPFDDAVIARSKLDELVTPGTAVYPKWQADLTRIADALEQLQKAGVVVLWRPFYEMNGFWYWYGTPSHLDDPKPWVRVYRQMFDYFVKQRHLNNLLWVYAPSHFASCGDKSRCKPVDWAYPGDDVVDIVGGTSYGNDMRIADYETYIKFPKPLIMSEYAPEGTDQDKGMSNTVYAERLLKDYPRIASWTSWAAESSMNTHPEAKELLNNPLVINRDRVAWKQFLNNPSVTP